MHTNDGERRRARRVAAAGAALALAFGLSSSAPARQGEEDERPVLHTKETLTQLAETRRLISEERRDWQIGRELLQSEIDVVAGEIESLRAKIRETQDNIAEADRKREELIEESERLKGASDQLVGVLAELETRTRGLLARFPEPLLDVVRPLSQRMPEDPAETRQSISERFLNVVGILKFANKFQRDISVASEVRTLPDGSTVEVTAMYVGLGQAWYANARGTIGGQGTPGPEGWTWAPLGTSSQAIARAIAIQASQEAAAFVKLPVAVD